MKKTSLLILFGLIGVVLFAQNEPKPNAKTKSSLRSRANDHFLLQVGVTKWAGIPDSIKTKGLSRSFNMYFMFDFPFKSNPHLSVGIGAGVGGSHGECPSNDTTIGAVQVTDVGAD